MMKSFFVVLSLLLALGVTGQTRQVNVQEVVSECMRNSEQGNRKQLVLWFPTVFWELVNRRSGVSPEFLQYISSEMSNYVMFAVAEYTTEAGQLAFTPEPTLRTIVHLKDSSGKVFQPLTASQLSPGATRLIDEFKPTMIQMLGQFGAGMQVYLFDRSKTTASFSISKPGQFSLVVRDNVLRWQLPLASAFPPGVCPVDSAAMKGNWRYCPFHGNALPLLTPIGEPADLLPASADTVALTKTAAIQNGSFRYPANWVLKKEIFPGTTEYSVTPEHMQHNTIKAFMVLQHNKDGYSFKKYCDTFLEFAPGDGKEVKKAKITTQQKTRFHGAEAFYIELLSQDEPEEETHMLTKAYCIQGKEFFYTIIMRFPDSDEKNNAFFFKIQAAILDSFTFPVMTTHK